MATTPLREALQGIDAEITAGRPGEALRLCDQLLATHPRWLDAQRLRARALVAIDRLPEAERMLDGILASNPEDGDAFCDRAYLMQRRGELLGALACYRRACELVRNNAGLRAAHNQLAAQLGRPPYTPSHTGLARLYLRAELFAHALREWDIALHANPNRLDAQIGMAETLWRSGDARHAQETSRYILGRMPLSLKPLLLLGFFHLEEGRIAEAQELVNLAGELDPDQRIAGELFGDLVASGHTGLAELFRAAVRSKTSPLLAPAAAGQTGVFPAFTNTPSRPVSEPLPTGQLPTGPLFASSRPDYELLPTGKLPYPPTNGNGEIEDFFSQSRASMLPDNFDKVFRETEYMLWSRDNEETNTAEIPVITPATPPPADDETDMAFVRWLQEQGARPIDETGPTATPAKMLPALPPSSPLGEPVGVPPFLQQALAVGDAAPLPALPPSASAEHEPAELTNSPRFERSGETVAPAPWLVTKDTIETNAQKPATPASASPPELAAPEPPKVPVAAFTASAEPATVPVTSFNAPTVPVPVPTESETDVIEATPQVTDAPTALIATNAEEPPPPTEPLPIITADPIMVTPTVPEPMPMPASSEPPTIIVTPMAPEPAPLTEIADVAPPETDPESLPVPEAAPEHHVPPPMASHDGNGDAPLTIEAIQQGLTSAGFARLETGRLAAVASSLTPNSGDAPAATTDVPKQLDAARALRREGRLGEALAEYRTLVKATTERIPEIIRDLRDAAIEAPNEAEVHRLLGDAYIREGDYVEALEAYNRASQLRQDEGNH